MTTSGCAVKPSSRRSYAAGVQAGAGKKCKAGAGKRLGRAGAVYDRKRRGVAGSGRGHVRGRTEVRQARAWQGAGTRQWQRHVRGRAVGGVKGKAGGARRGQGKGRVGQGWVSSGTRRGQCKARTGAGTWQGHVRAGQGSAGRDRGVQGRDREIYTFWEFPSYGNLTRWM